MVVGWLPTHYKVKLQLMMRLSLAVTITATICWLVCRAGHANLLDQFYCSALVEAEVRERVRWEEDYVTVATMFALQPTCNEQGQRMQGNKQSPALSKTNFILR